ncbi:DNA-processing protein DprA [Amedibacillus sp. YH-ame10]
MREAILYYAWKYDGDWKKIQRAMKNKEAWENVPYDGRYVTIVDEDYPKRLLDLEYAPWILFYEGDLSLCTKRSCGIVGSRIAEVKSMQYCTQVTNILKQKYVIVSGLAKGIDALAHKCALDASTIGVIGCGLQVIYPKENAQLYQCMRKHHLIISEYPPNSKPYAYHFPWRNRLIAALSDSIVVIEARKRSGTMLTVNEAISLDRAIYCVPHDFGSIDGVGCNLLISQGANILVDEEDIYMI